MFIHYPTAYLLHATVHLLTIALSSIATHWHHSHLLMNSHIICRLVSWSKIRIRHLLVFRFSLTSKNNGTRLHQRMWRAHRGVCRLWTAPLLRMITDWMEKIFQIYLCFFSECSEWLQDRRALRCRECRVSTSLRSNASPQLVYHHRNLRRDEQLSTWNLFWIEGSWFRACQGRCRTRSNQPRWLICLHLDLVSCSRSLFSPQISLILI